VNFLPQAINCPRTVTGHVSAGCNMQLACPILCQNSTMNSTSTGLTDGSDSGGSPFPTLFCRATLGSSGFCSRKKLPNLYKYKKCTIISIRHTGMFMECLTDKAALLVLNTKEVLCKLIIPLCATLTSHNTS
jgi:hypothetical protein